MVVKIIPSPHCFHYVYVPNVKPITAQRDDSSVIISIPIDTERGCVFSELEMQMEKLFQVINYRRGNPKATGSDFAELRQKRLTNKCPRFQFSKLIFMKVRFNILRSQDGGKIYGRKM